MSALDNTETINELVRDMTGGDDQQPAAEPYDDVRAYEDHQARTVAGTEPAVHASSAEEDGECEIETDLAGQKRVPLTALQKERQRRQELQKQLAAHQGQVAALQQQWQEFVAQAQAQAQAAATAQAQEQQPVPEFSEDPEGYVKAREAQFQRELAALKGDRAQAEQIEASARQLQHRVIEESQRLAPEVDRHEAEFKSRVGEAEYADAFNVVQADVLRTLQARAPGASQAELQVLGQLAAVEFLRNCAAAGENPCERVWARAQQLGFKPGARRAATPQGTPRGQFEGITLESVAAMDDAEFEQLFENMKRAGTARPAV